MNLKLTPFHFEELIKKGYSLDLIYLLKMVEQNIDLTSLRESSTKIETLYQTLIRKGILSEGEQKITTIGQDLLKFIETEEAVKIVVKKPASTEFDDWWKAYPGTDTFEYKGKKFTGSRSLRINKDQCRIKFDKILIEGEHTAKDLIEALKFDVQQKKENSVKMSTNKLTYMQNSLTYLNQRSFEPFIELIKEGEKIESAEVGGTDI